MADLTLAQQVQAVKWNWISQPFLIICLGLGKASVAFLTLRLIGPGSVWRRGLLWFCAVSAVTINLIGCILSFVQCDPPRLLWDATAEGSCWDPSVQADYALFSGGK
jgi:hypothetical protein